MGLKWFSLIGLANTQNLTEELWKELHLMMGFMPTYQWHLWEYFWVQRLECLFCIPEFKMELISVNLATSANNFTKVGGHNTIYSHQAICLFTYMWHPNYIAIPTKTILCCNYTVGQIAEISTWKCSVKQHRNCIYSHGWCRQWVFVKNLFLFLLFIFFCFFLNAAAGNCLIRSASNTGKYITVLSWKFTQLIDQTWLIFSPADNNIERIQDSKESAILLVCHNCSLHVINQ